MDDCPTLLHDIFAATAALHPHAVALEVPPSHTRRARRTLTYQQLAARVQALAQAMCGAVAPEAIVAVFLPRHDPDLFAAELAVLQAGGAWLAFDPLLPDEQLAFLWQDARPTLLVTSGELRERALGFGVPDEHMFDPTDLPDPAPRAEAPAPSPRSLAYVVYTSGTTGRPKGVLVEHQSIVHLALADRALFGLGPGVRVAQGSSHGYDSSIEETWLAFAGGATVVVLDDETMRLGPDLVPWLVHERIHVFCPPPTLLRTLGLDDPEVALPDVKLLYVGGEALPRDVADRWARGRRLVNGYGPTEATVTALRATIVAGGSIPIGVPVAGTTAYVLDERLEEVPAGELGELAIGGIGVARGYLDRPALTSERFPTHSRFGRLYRTGDLVRRDPEGTFHYEGRIDAQVKVRGHRIELEAVEAWLAAQPEVGGAACRLQATPTGDVLAAFVVPRDPVDPPRFADLSARMRASLPPAMVPSRFGLLLALPRLASGKLDRKALPAGETTNGTVLRESTEPFANSLEARIAAAFQEALDAPGPIGRDDDFFFDLGGHSVAAARAISVLRRDPGTASLAVRDLYEARHVAGLAARAAARGVRESTGGSEFEPGVGRPLQVTAVQGIWLLLELVAGAALLHLSLLVVLPWLLQRFGLLGTLCMLPLVGAAVFAVRVPLSTLALVAMKRMCIGRYRPLRAPAWGSFHVRHWILLRCARLVPWRALEETVFLQSVLRALGARIGKRVHIHRGVDLSHGGWDLLDIEDDAAVGRDALLGLVRIERGGWVVGPIRLGAGSVVETRAVVDAETQIGSRGHVTALSWLPRGSRLPANERWTGVPARAVEAESDPVPPSRSASSAPIAHGLAALVVRWTYGTAVYFLPFALLVHLWPGLDAARVLAGLTAGTGDAAFVWGLVAIAMVAPLLSALLAALAVRAMAPSPDANVSRWSFAWTRMRIAERSVSSAGNLLSGTLFWPPWLRLAGMRIGRGAEVSTIDEVVPRHVEIGGASFLADGIYLGGPRVRRGVVECAPTQLGKRTFLGNHVVVPAGERLPDDVLVGVSTATDGKAMGAGTSWFGHPAFALPQREVVVADRRLTHEPGAARYALRFALESLRVLLPMPPVLLLLVWLAVASNAFATVSTLSYFAWALPLAAAAAGLVSCMLVLALKWILLGRVSPGQHGLWSAWCSRWDLVYVAWGAWARGVLSAFEGTLFLAWYLRAMGMKIGRRVLLGDGFAHVVDPDMIAIDDHATVDAHFQAHTFEDRVLKMDRVHIGQGATVEHGALLFYGTDVGAGAHVMPQSVVMKRERLVAAGLYAGCPASPRSPGEFEAP